MKCDGELTEIWVSQDGARAAQQTVKVEQDLLCSNRGFIDLTECSEELLGAIVKKEDW